MRKSFDLSTLDGTAEAAKSVARRYQQLTGKPLGITGEIGELEAARLLQLTLADARQSGFDARASDGQRAQIKARCVRAPARAGGRLGSIRLDREWDTILLILMDQDFAPLEIYEADRDSVEAALLRPGSKSRNERGALAISEFKRIGQRRWPRESETPAEPADARGQPARRR